MMLRVGFLFSILFLSFVEIILVPNHLFLYREIYIFILLSILIRILYSHSENSLQFCVFSFRQAFGT